VIKPCIYFKVWREIKMKKGIISALSAFTGVVVGAGAAGRATRDSLRKIQGMSEKHLALFLMMNRWVRVKQEGKNLVQYFERKGYKKIAIYGMSYVGETLIEELKESEIEVAYGIDRNANSMYSALNIFSLEDSLDEVDAIVVTAITFFDEIEAMLSEKTDCPIVSLEDILYEI